MQRERNRHLRIERDQLRRMRWVSLLEGTTLVVLVFVAVPLKHLGGYPQATAVMGPVHGITFLLYVWMAFQTVAAGGWSAGETSRLLIVAFIPFGGLVNAGMLRRKEVELTARAGC